MDCALTLIEGEKWISCWLDSEESCPLVMIAGLSVLGLLGGVGKELPRQGVVCAFLLFFQSQIILNSSNSPQPSHTYQNTTPWLDMYIFISLIQICLESYEMACTSIHGAETCVPGTLPLPAVVVFNFLFRPKQKKHRYCTYSSSPPYRPTTALLIHRISNSHHQAWLSLRISNSFYAQQVHT